MKIEVLTQFKHDGQSFEPGEIRIVDDKLGEYFCRAGWVKDVDGVVETRMPDKNDVVLMVDNIDTSKTVEGGLNNA